MGTVYVGVTISFGLFGFDSILRQSYSIEKDGNGTRKSSSDVRFGCYVRSRTRGGSIVRKSGGTLLNGTADLGHTSAPNNLGNMYDNGLGVEQSFQRATELLKTAREWWTKAAEQGHEGAIENLKKIGQNRGKTTTTTTTPHYKSVVVVYM